MVLPAPTKPRLDGHVITIPGAGAIAPADAATPADIAALVDRVEAAEAATLGGLSDVDTTGAAEGMILAVNGSGVWVPETAPNGIDVANATAAVLLDAGYIDFSESFTVADNGDGGVSVFPRTGTTAGTLAAGDHLHPVPVVNRYSHANPAAIPNIGSGGDTTLISQAVGTFAVDVPTLVNVRGYVYAEGVDDPARAHVYLTIDGNTARTSDIAMVEAPTWEWGVNSVFAWEHSATITRTGAGAGSRTVALGVTWQGGGSLDVKAAWIVVTRTAYR